MKISKKVTRDTKVARDIFENRNVTGYFLCHGEKKNTAPPPLTSQNRLQEGGGFKAKSTVLHLRYYVNKSVNSIFAVNFFLNEFTLPEHLFQSILLRLFRTPSEHFLGHLLGNVKKKFKYKKNPPTFF